MKLLISLILALVPFYSFAGGVSGGGTGPRPTNLLAAFAPVNTLGGIGSKEIVFNMGQKNGIVKFAYGQLVENQWQIQKIEILKADLLNEDAVIRALQDSEAVNGWSPIK